MDGFSGIVVGNLVDGVQTMPDKLVGGSVSLGPRGRFRLSLCRLVLKKARGDTKKL